MLIINVLKEEKMGSREGREKRMKEGEKSEGKKGDGERGKGSNEKKVV